jgi:hypothetical protein
VHIIGTKAQAEKDPLYDASNTTTGAAQLIRPQVPSCSHFLIQNNSSTAAMWVDFGSARAAATLTGGSVSSIAVTNAGFNFTHPPLVRFAGGGKAGNGSYLGLNQPGGQGPNSQLGAGRPALAHAVLSGQSVASIVIDDPGAGYVIAPFVFLMNTDLDPYGCAAPSATAGAGSIQIGANGGNYYMNGTVCPTDPIAIFCASSGQSFTFKWMI